MSKLSKVFQARVAGTGSHNTLFNAGWLTAARLSSDFSSVLLFIIISRYFGPVGVGQYVFGFAVAGLAYVAVNLGLEDYGVRECSRLATNTRHVLISKLISTQLGLTFVALMALLCFLTITEAELDTAVIILILCLHQIALGLSQTLFIPAFAHESMRGAAITELVCRGGAAVIAVLLITGLQTSLVTALMIYPVGGIALVSLGALSARRHLPGVRIRITWQEAVAVIKSSWAFAGAQVVYKLYTRVPLLLLGSLLGQEATGIYGAGLKLLEVGVMPFVLLGVAAYPGLSRLFEEKDTSGFIKAADNLLKGELALSAVLAWILIVAPSILIPLLGDGFASTATLMMPMAALAILMAIENSAVRLLLATHLQIQRIKVQFWGTILSVGLNSCLIPILGIRGAVVAAIATSCFMNTRYVLALRAKGVAAMMISTVGQFLTILMAVSAIGTLIIWFKPHPWFGPTIALAVFFIIILWSGFLPFRRDLIRPLDSSILTRLIGRHV